MKFKVFKYVSIEKLIYFQSLLSLLSNALSWTAIAVLKRQLIGGPLRFGYIDAYVDTYYLDKADVGKSLK